MAPVRRTPNPTPVRAYQLFQAVSDALAEDVFRSLRETHRDVYKGVVISLAQERRLRPVFIQRKPVDAQIDWLVKTVKLKSSDGVAEHILQVWLLKSHKDLLVGFLDGLGIEHDGEGSVDELPDELDAEKLGQAIDGVLQTHPPELVATYLWVFQMQKPEGWPALIEILREDARLRLGAPAPVAPPEAASEVSSDEAEEA